MVSLVITSCLILSLLLVPAGNALPVDAAVSYEGYQVVRIRPATERELKSVQGILQNNVFSTVDVWQEPSRPGSPVDVNVPPQVYPMLINELKSRGITYDIKVNDVQKHIDVENSRTQQARRQQKSKKGSSIVGSYASYADIVTWSSNLAKTNSKVTLQSYGKSVEGRGLTLVKISNSMGNKKPIIFIEAGIHAREWISPATAIWIINQLATSTDADVVSLLDAADWYVVPVANPDGYEYTQSTDRFWRKNRSKNKGSTCRGVDLNRNWDSQWRKVGASRMPCDETYAGTSAFSEPETKGLSDVILGAKANIKAYFSLHSYSQAWLTSWGYTWKAPPDLDALMYVANKGADALRAVNGTYYDVGPGAVIFYAASGCSDDWAKEKAGIKYSYTLELRDTGDYGFLLPSSQIEPTGIETWEGIKTSVKLILA